MYNVITTEDELRDLVAHYSHEAVGAFTFDVETVGDHRIDPVRNYVVWISMACDDRTDVIPIGHPNGEYLHTERPLTAAGEARKEKGLPIRESDYSRDEKRAVKVFGPPPVQLHAAEVFAALRPLFFSSVTKVGHNIKFDLKSVTKYFGGTTPPGPYADTMIGQWVLDTRLTGALGLAPSLKREFDHDMAKGVGAEVEKYSFEEVAKYSAEDARWTHRLWREKVEPRLKEERLHKVFKLEMDVLGALCSMELHGAYINKQSLQMLKDRLDVEIEEAKGRIFKEAGRPFNINSNTEKQNLLFKLKKDGGRGLKPKKRTATGAPSVAADALEPLRGRDALVDALLDYADINKLLSTYVIPYLGGEVTRTTGTKTKVTHRESLLVKGRLHTDFVQHGAETGRFSSRNPNLQNVPNASTPHGMAIRNLFCAPEGHVLVCADYSQIEPRIIASFSKDPVFMGAYERGEDVYTALAEPLGLPRSGGKIAVLAMSYGVGPEKVENSLGLVRGSGKQLLDDFEQQFAAVYKYKRKVVAEARNQRPLPYVSTILGRRRYLPDLRSNEFGLKSRAERQAFNTLIQGSAADIMKIAIVRAHAMLPKEAHLMLTVHDELLTVCPEAMADEVAEIIREAMEGIHVLDIPLIADVKVAQTWGAAK
jgi:DNA polymerase-1